ncbi:MAG: DUF5674 family protein [Candidatus Kuenenbacteria bacterium]
MKIITNPIKKDELVFLAKKKFGHLVKAVVDIKQEIIALDAELHADLEALLLENNSRQEDLWGINFYPTQPEKKMIEFDSMINIRPSQKNRSRDVENPEIRKKIREIVKKLVIM